MKEYKVINANIFNPVKSIFKRPANEKAECQVISCNNSENCDLYKTGECYLKQALGGACPHGKYNVYVGFSKRAAKFSSWIREQEEKYKEVGNKLSSPSKIIAKVGDYIYLPYAHMNMNEHVPFLSPGGFMRNGSSFILKKGFTIDVIKRILTFKPMALMGGEIKSYQEEQVPLFITHLSEFDSKLFKKLCDELPYLEDLVKEKTNVGRKAMLFSLTPNIGTYTDIHKASWVWDGLYLTSENSKASFMLAPKFDQIRVKPSSDFEVTITDDNQVNENTIFKS